MIDSLLYQTISTPNILFIVCLCVRFQSDLRETQLTVVKRIFSYLKGTNNQGLLNKRFIDYKFVGFYDVDYVGNRIEIKSTNEGCQFIGENLISQASKILAIIALSTT